MGKDQKYTEDQLLEAVVKYSEQYRKKIKATELANWSRDNIEGLEEVRDYHFTRPIKEKDPKTGKLKERQKICTKRIEEINKARSITFSINSNMLLRTSNIDIVFEQSQSIQRKLIAETRETFDILLTKNCNLERENEALRTINKEQKVAIEDITFKIAQIQKMQSKLERQVNYIMKATDENNRKEALKKMGLEDETIDLNTYTESLQQSLNEVMNINKILLSHIANNLVEETPIVSPIPQIINKHDLSKAVLSGIDFD